MSYELRFSDRTTKDIKKLSRETKERIFKKLEEIAENPSRSIEEVKGHRDYSKLRIGDYRVIVRVREDLKEIHVLHVGHRSTVYEEIERFL